MPTISTEQYLPFTVEAKDGRGRSVALQSVTAVSSDETVVSVEIAAGTGNAWDGKINSLAPTVEGGTSARVVITADADLGEGVREVMATIEDITVTLDERTNARMLEVTAGEAQDKEAA